MPSFIKFSLMAGQWLLPLALVFLALVSNWSSQPPSLHVLASTAQSIDMASVPFSNRIPRHFSPSFTSRPIPAFGNLDTGQQLSNLSKKNQSSNPFSNAKAVWNSALGGALAKSVYAVAGISVMGTLAFHLIKSILTLRLERSFARFQSPMSDLLGPVLMKNELVGDRLREKRIPTANYTGADTVTILYFTGKAVEDYMQKNGFTEFTPLLKRIYEACRDKGQRVEIIYIPVDTQFRASQTHFRTMPWLSIPFNNKKLVRKLLRRFGISSLPAAVVLDSNAQVINEKAYNTILTNPEGYPWPKQSINELLGETFVNVKNETVSKSSLDGKIIGLYFSAGWCPPCKQFTPILSQAYQHLKDSGKDFEVIFISNDENKNNFTKYYSENMPWLAIPYEDVKRRALLQDSMEVKSLPTLVILDEHRQVITHNGRQAIQADPTGEKFPWIPKLVNEISESIDGITESPSIVVFNENGSNESQANLMEVLHDFAKKEKNLSTGRKIRLFVANSHSPRAMALRKMCKLPPAIQTSGKSQSVDTEASVVLLDLRDQSFYNAPNAPLTRESLINWVNDFRQDLLIESRHPIHLPQ